MELISETTLRAAGRHQQHRAPLASHLLATLLVSGSFLLSTRIHVTGPAFATARSLHVIGLVVAFGPVLLLDWYGLAWFAHRRRFTEVRRLADATDPLIWIGIGLLALSGVFLAPSLSEPTTLAKIGFILVLVNNGVSVRGLGRRLAAAGEPDSLRELPPGLRRRLVVSVAVSQTAWWGALAIGLLTTARRGGA